MSYQFEAMSEKHRQPVIDIFNFYIYFLKPDHTRKGLGARILNEFTHQAQSMGADTLLACISSLNLASIRFHQKQGFKECGRLARIGRKFEQDFDVVWMQKQMK